MKAFAALGGSIYPREAAASRSPMSRLHPRARPPNHRAQPPRIAPVLKRYERVCFTKEAVSRWIGRALIRAALLHPGHPLMLAVSDLLLEQHGNLLRQGAILVDPADEGEEPHSLFLLTHEIKSGDGQVLSKRLQFVRVAPDGWPHSPVGRRTSTSIPSSADRALLAEVLARPGFAPTRNSVR